MRKLGRFTAYFFIVICVLVDIRVLFFMPATTGVSKDLQLPDYSAAQSLAEHAASLYLTYTSESDPEGIELSKLIPSIARTSPPKGVIQTVDQIKALQPAADTNDVYVPVDCWVTAKKQNEDPVHRHLVLTFKVFLSNGKVAIDGPPSVEKVLLADGVQAGQSSKQMVPDTDVKEMRLMLQSFLNDYFSSTDPESLKNSLVSGAQVNPLGGLYQYKEIQSLSVSKKTSGGYTADVQVTAIDPVLNLPVQTRVVVDLEKQSDRYLISHIGLKE